MRFAIQMAQCLLKRMPDSYRACRSSGARTRAHPLVAQLFLVAFLLAGAGYASSVELAASSLSDGGTSTNATVMIDGSFGESGAYASTSGSELKGGYAGALYDRVGLLVSGNTSVNERASTTLLASYRMDDETRGALEGAPAWAMNGFPLAGLAAGPDGAAIVTAGTVYRDTTAPVGITQGNLAGGCVLTVRNVDKDDFGAYAGDDIEDSWEVRYYGEQGRIPNAGDPNAVRAMQYAFSFGLDPTNPDDTFRLRFAAPPSNTTTLAFSPVFPDRTYLLESTTNLAAGTWSPADTLFEFTQDGLREVTRQTTNAVEFYRVRVQYDWR